MLNKISLENFKSFKQLNDLHIKPITILCGTNSCGKSSILQSLLLLKQTLESQNPNQTLLLNGRFVRLGVFENIIFKKNVEDTIRLSFSFKISRGELQNVQRKASLPVELLLRDLFPPIFSERIYIPAEYLINYRIELRTTKTRSRQYRLKPIIVHNLELNVQAVTKKNEVIPGSFIKIQHKNGNSYDIEWKNIKPRLFRPKIEDEINIKEGSHGNLVADLQFSNLFPMTFDISEAEVSDSRFYRDVHFVLRRANTLLQTLLTSYSYIGPLREEPSRRYIYEDEILEIGTKGENAAYIYLAEGEKVVDYYLYDIKSESLKEKKAKLSLAVQEWLELMGIKKFTPERKNEIIYLNLNASLSDKTRVSIADVGFGVSQIFPIVLEGLRMPRGRTLLLEQPEIHLHPNLQMEMADYFISLALSGKKVIVETHSDHIVNRLVRRIVEDEKNELSDLIGIYFIESTENGSVYEEVCVDETLGIVNWPNDFFDQVAKEQQKIMMAGLRKRKFKRTKEDQ
jgi:predicted ATPase